MFILRCVFCGIILSFCAFINAEDYEIKITRALEVNQQYAIDMWAREKSATTINTGGKVETEKEDIWALVTGVLTVTAVNDIHQMIGCKIEIQRCAKCNEVDDADWIEMLDKGAIVSMGQNDDVKKPKTIFKANGKLVTQDQHEILELFFSVSEATITNDDILGTKDRKAIGDAWPIDATLAAEDINIDIGDIFIEEKNIAGVSSVEKRKVVDGIPCLIVNSEITISSVGVGNLKGFTVIESSASASMMVNMPIDTNVKGDNTKGTFNMNLKAKSTTTQSPAIFISIEADHIMRSKWKFIK